MRRTLWVTLICVTGASIASSQESPGARTLATSAPAARPSSTTAATAARAPSRDSVRAVDAAHHAQAAFERTRRALLPRLQPSSTDPCDVRIGRLCYWHRDEDSMPAEPFGITHARDRLIDQLMALTRVAPTDPWIVGESVLYLVEAGYDSSAVVAVRSCKSTPWWCAALRGFVLHDLERYAEADAAFDTALARMPEAERCAWNDLSLLLPDDARDEYARMPCAQRVTYEKRFWELADPSYIVPGNDRRTEHFARLVTVTLSRNADNAYGLPWGDDLRELVLRYGVPIGFTTTWRDDLTDWRPVIGHDREPSFQFSAVHPTHDDAYWDLRAAQARERYAPRYVHTLTDFRAQFAMFKRGDSALVIATYADTGSATSRTLLGVTDDAGGTVESDAGGNVRVRQSKTAWKSVVVGVERYDTAGKRLERAREWLAPPHAITGAPALSTVLLYAPVDTNGVASLADAERAALASSDLGSSRKVGLYWEMYGVHEAFRRSATPTSATLHGAVQDSVPDITHHIIRDTTRDTTISAPHDSSSEIAPDTTAGVHHDTLSQHPTLNAPAPDSAMTVSITIVRTDRGVWHWLAQRLRLETSTSPITMGWHDLPGTPDGVGKSVVLDLAQLPAGHYRIEVAAGTDAEHRTMTTRDIQLR